MLCSVKAIAGRGRGLVASQTIRCGSIALEDTAFAAVLNHDARDSHCSHCFAPSTIATDDHHHFCSAECMDNAFTLHDRLLNKCDLVHLDNGQTNRYPRLIAKMTAAALLAGPNFNDYWAKVLALAAPNTHCAEQDEFNALIRVFEPAIGKEATEKIFEGPLPLEWYSRMIGILHVNSIGMGKRDPHVTVADLNSSSRLVTLQKKASENPNIGVGLFPTASLLNHSCKPNVEMFRSSSKHSPTCVFVAVRHIEEGEELTISYLPDAYKKSVHERKDYLEYNYGFKCDCPLCKH